MTERDTLLTSDAAKILGVTPDAVRAMVRRGALTPATVTVGGVALFAPSDIFALARTRRERRSSPAAGSPFPAPAPSKETR